MACRSSAPSCQPDTQQLVDGLTSASNALPVPYGRKTWHSPATDVLAEGLLILAWVALWRPAEVALFDHWENRENRRQLERLAKVKLRFVREGDSPEITLR